MDEEFLDMRCAWRGGESRYREWRTSTERPFYDVEFNLDA
jgi:hypothetical protein